MEEVKESSRGTIVNQASIVSSESKREKNPNERQSVEKQTCIYTRWPDAVGIDAVGLTNGLKKRN
jgi:hypothetical protein